MTEFKAVVLKKDKGKVTAELNMLTAENLTESDVLIKVAYSSVNYKDGLAKDKDGGIIKHYPFVPGIDLAGEVVSSKDNRFKAGDKVIATSYDIGVSHYGGYSEYASIPKEWIVPLPDGLTLKESMIIGTAGFTAALAVTQLEKNGLTKEDGNVLVTGATGGSGSLAVSMLAKNGYSVTASTGKDSEHEYLKRLGATEIISREAVYNGSIKTMGHQKWAAAVDAVGGEVLAAIVSQLKYRGSVAVFGMAAGVSVPANVLPFILRGVNILGVDSVYCPMTEREKIWKRLAGDLKPEHLEEVTAEEISLSEVPHALSNILSGSVRGRIIVKM